MQMYNFYFKNISQYIDKNLFKLSSQCATAQHGTARGSVCRDKARPDSGKAAQEKTILSCKIQSPSNGEFYSDQSDIIGTINL